MSFWRTFGFHTISAIDTLLEKPDCTLQELYDEDELLQECKSQNRRLLDLLVSSSSSEILKFNFFFEKPNSYLFFPFFPLPSFRLPFCPVQRIFPPLLFLFL